ncbi:MAG: glycerophosphodiester phosphodiesterase family protein [Armatimonadota bacterium]|nr:glycerophosphodiester phosphodiesterase family protein [Armatimonadota bacterium]
MRRILVGAHRGAMCYAPENTLAAFEKAIAQGAYRVEFDVRRCASGEIVVMHDATVDRTTNGTGRVADLTLAQLKGLKVGGSEPIPTLAETLALARGRCRLLVEVKDEGITDDVVAEIARMGMLGACTLSSFSEATLLRAKAISPALATAYFHLQPGPFDPVAVVERLGVSLLVVWPKAAVPDQIAAAKGVGLHVRCGLPDTLTYEETWAEFRRLAAMGVDEVACGRPDWIARMAEEYLHWNESR